MLLIFGPYFPEKCSLGRLLFITRCPGAKTKRNDFSILALNLKNKFAEDQFAHAQTFLLTQVDGEEAIFEREQFLSMLEGRRKEQVGEEVPSTLEGGWKRQGREEVPRRMRVIEDWAENLEVNWNANKLSNVDKNSITEISENENFDECSGKPVGSERVDAEVVDVSSDEEPPTRKRVRREGAAGMEVRMTVGEVRRSRTLSSAWQDRVGRAASLLTSAGVKCDPRLPSPRQPPGPPYTPHTLHQPSCTPSPYPGQPTYNSPHQPPYPPYPHQPTGAPCTPPTFHQAPQPPPTSHQTPHPLSPNPGQPQAGTQPTPRQHPPGIQRAPLSFHLPTARPFNPQLTMARPSNSQLTMARPRNPHFTDVRPRNPLHAIIRPRHPLLAMVRPRNSLFAIVEPRTPNPSIARPRHPHHSNAKPSNPHQLQPNGLPRTPLQPEARPTTIGGRRPGDKLGRKPVGKAKPAVVAPAPACEYERIRAANIAEREAMFQALGIQGHVREVREK